MNITVVRACCFVLLMIGCGGGGGGGGSDSSGAFTEGAGDESLDGEDDVEVAASEGASPRVSALCGMFDADEQDVRATPSSEMEQVSAEVLSSDAAIITRQTGELAGQAQLVKFHGITSEGVSSLRILNGIDVLSRELAEGAFFLSAGEGCEVVFPGGGPGILGQLFSLSGESMTERMLMEGSALPFGGEVCRGDALAQCYATIGVTPREPTAIELEMQEVSLPSRCGAVRDGAAVNPATVAEVVRVEPVDTSLVVVTPLLGVEAGQSRVVKLHGLSAAGISPTRLQRGIEHIINASSGGALFVGESRECVAELPDGTAAIHGQLYSADGASINEELLANGYAVSAADGCGGDQLLGCYQQIQLEAPPEPAPPPPAADHPTSDEDNEGYVEGVIRDFLWKPRSESNGNVAVLVNPTNVRVVVSGAIRETLRNTGPSNGRGTTARGSAPGCRYGNNVTLEFFDRSGQPIPIITGGTTITIPDGCDRVEFRR